MKGICFKSFLLKQLIAGKKTMTRRTGGLEKVNKEPDRWMRAGLMVSRRANIEIMEAVFAAGGAFGGHTSCKPKYNKGEIVYVKEGYIPGYFPNGITAYASFEPTPLKFKNKLFMPASEARYFVRIEDVYPQRLQEITEEDALAEGVLLAGIPLHPISGWVNHLSKIMTCPTAKDSFATLIDSMSGKGTWDKNPWVWVYKIKLVSEPDCIKTAEGYYPKSLHNDAEDSIRCFSNERLKNRFKPI